MIYLDNAATSFPKPECVYCAVNQAMRELGGNAGRGAHKAASNAMQTIKETRAHLSAFLGISDPSRLVFTMNTTDSLNMAIKGFVRENDHVVTTQIEHNSVLRPLAGLESMGKIQATRIPVGSDGFVDPSDIDRAINLNTSLVVVTHASNVLGTIQPVSEIGRICREKGVALLVDAAQSAGEISVDVEELGADMLAFPGHKSLLGLQGTGGLFVREGITLRHWREGGTGTVSANENHPVEYPVRLEAGTLNLPGIIGLNEGIKYIEERGMDEMHTQCMNLIKKIIDALDNDNRFIVYGSRDLSRHVHALSFNIRDVDANEVGIILDQSFDIAVRAGLHCAAPIHRIMGSYPSGTVRVSPGPMTSDDDVNSFIEAVFKIAG